jgi:hypothetical protein
MHFTDYHYHCIYSHNTITQDAKPRSRGSLAPAGTPPPHSRFQGALFAAIGASPTQTEPKTEPVSDVNVNSESYALAVAPLLLLSHHPLVAHSRRGGRRLWKRATAVLGGCEALLSGSGSSSGSGGGTAAAAAAATAAFSEAELVR